MYQLIKNLKTTPKYLTQSARPVAIRIGVIAMVDGLNVHVFRHRVDEFVSEEGAVRLARGRPSHLGRRVVFV